MKKSPFNNTAAEMRQHKHTGDGWNDRLVQPFLEIVCMVDPTVIVSQIKEKFGTLNIYHMGPPWVEKLADIFEAASEMCCEDCGRWDGHHRDGDENWGVSHVTTSAGPTGWIKTLCVRCRNVRQEEEDKRRAEYALKYPDTKRGDVV